MSTEGGTCDFIKKPSWNRMSISLCRLAVVFDLIENPRENGTLMRVMDSFLELSLSTITIDDEPLCDWFLVVFSELAKYIPDGKLDPMTFHTVMDAANAKYYLAKVINKTNMSWSMTITKILPPGCLGRGAIPGCRVHGAQRFQARHPRRQHGHGHNAKHAIELNFTKKIFGTAKILK